MNDPKTARRQAVTRRIKNGGILAAAVFAGLSSITVYSALETNPGSHSDAANIAPLGAPRSFSNLVTRVGPAVVNISVESGKVTGAMPHRFQFEPGMPVPELFRHFFERGQEPNRVLPQAYKRAAGSGFIIDPDGYIITNHHVIRDGDAITVVLNGGAEHKARVLGYDKKTDLALLKVDASGLPFVQFGDSDNAKPGDWVIAIGNPFGLGGTVTSGIVSARGRDIQAGPFDDFIQIDASINRGNSGGPLFDATGKVIGINTAIFSPNGGNVGIGFAIPSNLAAAVIEDLKDDGTVSRGYLGIQIQAMNPGLGRSFGLEDTAGALVSSVSAGSPAEAADFRVGDVILKFGESDISTVRDLPKAVASADPGQNVRVHIWRDGESREIMAKVGEPTKQPTQTEVAGADVDKARIGVWLAPIDSHARRNHGLSNETQGVVVTKVEPGGPAARQGLRSGDIITRIGAESVTTPADVAAGVTAASREKQNHVVLLVSRRGNHRFVAVPLT